MLPQCPERRAARTDLHNAGATWKDEAVVRDGHLITSRKPDDIPQFADAVIEALR
ncbi:putative intracellular protease/amidase [Lysobacter sp. HA18]